ncbi:carbohydrate ABC transporter membrane protein 1 (CUT1 family) [Halanaerobium saccharolyticum]|uniref:Carbohydrate ABC transporter membrane protein 1 (CUT1 family) n=1 Tax=Halanaerobium saccharolyticum TaxID=43595 RepID=A0A4R7ZCV0_9FIRM|nr:sugar ABC transporter permease [Halanaerobium saccharolyticum]RAK12585.1 carbohydrate ABC transporter membrane protein 1 (CUT1 family) [Halanaerobium saccharolyticum]TDW06511.1 carbohydrate ABC transporter membrane protein 1 (CUT1 family) [Halanaerobium saccharolyticum]TDX61759.1 carbohydrate ABC transporter membrane protein 1 (CUT1 family) [Halanaerobium saccharolyticum]
MKSLFSLKTEHKYGYIFILPVAAVLGILIIYPLLYGFYISFFQTNLINRWNFVELENYINIFSGNSEFVNSIFVSIKFTSVVVLSHLVLGLLLAVILNKKNLPFKELFRSILMIPWFFPEVVVALLWRWIFNSMYGVFNYLLMNLNIIEDKITWLSSMRGAFFVVVFTAVWKGYPLILVMILAGLQSIPEELYEVAKIDGANSFQTFFYITLPNLRSVLLVSLILDTVWWFKNFPIVWLMTRGGPVNATNVVSIDIYQTAFQSFNFGKASASAVIVFFICLGIAMIYKSMITEEEM